MSDDDSQARMMRRMGPVLAVPWIMVAAIVLGYFAGAYLDTQLDCAFPVATIVLMLAGIALGGYQSYRLIMKVLRD